jgi:predicted GH43/DUF377 family glycosyl hydrolase
MVRAKRGATAVATILLLVPLNLAQGKPSGRQWRSPSEPPVRIVFKKVIGSGTGGSVFDAGPPGAFDNWVTCPSVLFDGKVYRMWYSSMYHSKDGPRGIGLATSVDGLNWTRANGGQPVFGVGAKGAFDWAQILSPEVYFDGRRYLMWYTGIDGSINPRGFELERLGLATSKDGVHWTRANGGKPVLELGPRDSHDDAQVAYPSVIREGAYYRMWYSAYADKHNHTIVVAHSRDGIHWVRENEGKPVTGLTPAIAYAPSVIRWGGKLLMLYTGGPPSPRPWGIFAAISDDGINWRMINDGETFVPFGEGTDFARDNQSHPFLLPLRDRLLVWYTGFNRGPSRKDPLLFRIGLAEAFN